MFVDRKTHLLSMVHAFTNNNYYSKFTMSLMPPTVANVCMQPTEMDYQNVSNVTKLMFVLKA